MNLQNVQYGGDLQLEYSALLSKIETLLLSYSIVKDTGISSVSNFWCLTDEQKLGLTDRLARQLDIFLEATEVDINLDVDNLELLNVALRKLKLRAPGDFLETVERDDIIEIFSTEGEQLFRNLKFFQISDYSVDDFYGRRWDELYERSKVLTQKLFDRMTIAVNEKKCIPFAIEEHYMREKFTKNRKVVKVNLKYVAPLFSGDRVTAWIASSKATVVVECSNVESEKLGFISGSYSN